MVAGCPHRDNGLMFELLQLPGSFNAPAVDAGIASHTVLLNCAITLNRVFTCGSAIRYKPGTAAAIFSE